MVETEQFLDKTEQLLKASQTFAELVGKNFDHLTAIVERRLVPKDKKTWTELTKKRIEVRTKVYSCASKIKLQAQECSIIAHANDLNGCITHLNSAQTAKQLVSLIKDCQDLSGLLSDFKLVLDQNYKSCQNYKALAVGLASIVAGIGFFIAAVVCWPAAGAAACAYVPSLALGAASGGAVINGGVMAYRWKENRNNEEAVLNEIEKLKEPIKKEVKTIDTTIKHLSIVKSHMFEEGKEGEEKKMSELTASIQKELLIHRFQVIIKECDTLMSVE